MNKKTIALTEEQYTEIITTIKTGFSGFRSNERLATALTLEANLGIRISDIIKLSMNSFICVNGEYHIQIVEQKTQKQRNFIVPTVIYNYIKIYAMNNYIKDNNKLFDVTTTAIQKQLKIVCDYLGYTDISTHSFRKFFATEIYKNNDYNIVLVQQLLQHSSVSTTQKYIGINSQEINKALLNHIKLI